MTSVEDMNVLEVWAKALKHLRQVYGEETIQYALLSFQIIIGALIAYGIWCAIFAIRTPSDLKKRLAEAEKEKQRNKEKADIQAKKAAALAAKKGQQNGVDANATSTDSATTNQSGAGEAAASESNKTLFAREATHPSPTAYWKGFSQLGFVACSPNGSYVVTSDRKSRKVQYWPMHNEFIHSIKDTLNVMPVPNLTEQCIATRCFFSGTGEYFAVFDLLSSALVVFSSLNDSLTEKHDQYKSTGSVRHRISWVIPKTLPIEKFDLAALSSNGSHAFFFTTKDAAVDVYDMRVKGSERESYCGQQRVKVGNASWSIGGNCNRVVAAGSYIVDARIQHIDLMHGKSHANFSLVPEGMLTNKDKSSHCALTADGELLFLVLPQKNKIELWDVDVKFDRGENAPCLGFVEDVDFTHDLTHVVTGRFPHSATSTKKDTFLALVKADSFVVYLIQGGNAELSSEERSINRSKASPVAFRRAAEVHDAHDGEPIKDFGFVQRGRGCVTGSDSDGRNALRLWSFMKGDAKH